MTKFERIEQISPNSEPYRAIYVFSNEGEYQSSSIQTLSSKELKFYQLPEVNKHLVTHKWLDNLSKLEELTEAPTEKIFETTVPFALSHSFSETPTEELEEYVVDPTLSFDDPNRYEYKPKENNSDVPF